MKFIRVFTVIILILSCISCSKISGRFCFQTPDDKSFKIKQTRLEFDSSWDVKWMYQFLSSPPTLRVNLGVTVLKKEFGWIDIFTTQDYINATKNAVYGNLKDMEPGEYKIVILEMLAEKTRVIDQCEFMIYSDEESDE